MNPSSIKTTSRQRKPHPADDYLQRIKKNADSVSKLFLEYIHFFGETRRSELMCQKSFMAILEAQPHHSLRRFESELCASLFPNIPLRQEDIDAFHDYAMALIRSYLPPSNDCTDAEILDWLLFSDKFQYSLANYLYGHDSRSPKLLQKNISELIRNTHHWVSFFSYSNLNPGAWSRWFRKYLAEYPNVSELHDNPVNGYHSQSNPEYKSVFYPLPKVFDAFYDSLPDSEFCQNARPDEELEHRAKTRTAEAEAEAEAEIGFGIESRTETEKCPKPQIINVPEFYQNYSNSRGYLDPVVESIIYPSEDALLDSDLRNEQNNAPADSYSVTLAQEMEMRFYSNPPRKQHEDVLEVMKQYNGPAQTVIEQAFKYVDPDEYYKFTDEFLVEDEPLIYCLWLVLAERRDPFFAFQFKLAVEREFMFQNLDPEVFVYPSFRAITYPVMQRHFIEVEDKTRLNERFKCPSDLFAPDGYGPHHQLNFFKKLVAVFKLKEYPSAFLFRDDLNDIGALARAKAKAEEKAMRWIDTDSP